jgi:hypothetical protein
MANQVTLTIAGDPSGAVKAFDRVGAASKDMDKTVRDAGQGFDRVAEGADNVDTKAMGFRDTLTGIQDSTKGIKMAASGDWGFETLLTLGFGLGDLASGMFNLVIPAFKSMTLALKSSAVAQKAAAAAQWLMNAAQLASPITWIIIAIVALIAIIVLIATKTDWFSRAWRASWDWIKKAASNTWDFLKKIPGWIGSAFSKVAGFISAPYRAAFNLIARAWNSTVGRLAFTFPDWIPGLGGKTISVPNLPTFHAGGVVPGVRGEAVPIMAQAGERVSGVASSSSGEQWIRLDMGDLGEALRKAVASAVERRGGRVTALGVAVVGGQVRT